MASFAVRDIPLERLRSEVEAGLKRIGFETLQQIVWAKPIFAMSRQHYHWQHEPAWYARKKGEKVPWYGGHKQSTVWGYHEETLWEAPSPKMPMGARGGPGDGKVDHPTQKPVVVYARPIRNHLRPGEALYDPFGGFGTAIVAAEQEGRVAYVMECEPRFCDVIRERYASVCATTRP